MTDANTNGARMVKASGQLRVRWARILAFMSAVVIIDSLGAAIVSRFTQMPINTDFLLAPLCVVAAYIVVAIDLQRQRLLHGNWRFRLRLQTLFLLTATASAFFALLAHTFARINVSLPKARQLSNGSSR